MENATVVAIQNSQTLRPTESMEAILIRDEGTTALAAVISFMAVIIVLGTVGNILVILAVAQRKKLHTVSNMFVANLSFCDLLFVSVVLPVNMYTYLGQGWRFPAVVCKFVGFLCYTLTGTTVITITLIAWNRYKLVVDISRYKQLFRPRNMGLMLAASWIIPGACLQPAVFGTWGHFDYIPMLSSCNLDLDNSSRSFKMFLLIVRAAVPCGLIVYFYNAIYATTRASHERLHHITRSFSSSMRHHSHRREMRLTRMMIGIFMVFVISYFPCTISSVIDWSQLLSKTIHMFCQTSVFLGSAVNPLLYGFMNEQFRSAYFQILTCRTIFRRSQQEQFVIRETSCIENNEDKLDEQSEATSFKTNETSQKEKSKICLTNGEIISTPQTISPSLKIRWKDQILNSESEVFMGTSKKHGRGVSNINYGNEWYRNINVTDLSQPPSFHSVYLFHNSCI